MKIKKIFASIAAIAMMATTFATTASAASDVIDFENSDFSFVSMKTDDGGDASKLSVVDFNGSKQLKVEIQDSTLIPKIKFDFAAMIGSSNLENVDKITLDMTIESQDGVTPPGWSGGAIGTQAPNWSQGDWTVEEYENSTSATTTIERKFLLPTDKLVNDSEDPHLLVMKWAGEVGVNIYIDNITFLDKDGNKIAVNIGGAPATSNDAPAADGNTTSSGTGNTAATAIVSVMAIAGAAAIATKKRK